MLRITTWGSDAMDPFISHHSPPGEHGGRVPMTWTAWLVAEMTAMTAAGVPAEIRRNSLYRGQTALFRLDRRERGEP